MARPRTASKAALVTALALAACSHAHVQNTGEALVPTGPLPRPEVVVVDAFAVDPSEVKLDKSVGAELRALVSGDQTNQNRAAVAAQVRGVVVDTLVQRIQAMGLPAVGTIGEPAAERVVTIRGQILDIDQGNRTRRTLIGFGAGKSDVGADVQVYYWQGRGTPTLIGSFSADADSGHMPGAAVTFGAGAAAGNVARSAALSAGTHAATAGKSEAAGRADALANGVANSLATLFRQQGWIAGG